MPDEDLGKLGMRMRAVRNEMGLHNNGFLICAMFPYGKLPKLKMRK